MAIYLLRHGESEGNLARVNQGRIDLPLTARGREQAALAGRWLARLGVEPEVIYSSPLRRAWETAEIIIQELEGAGPCARPAMNESDPGGAQGRPPSRIVVHEEPDVIEYHVGEAGGLSVEELAERFPDFEHRTLDERGCWAQFGGESYEDVQARLQRFIEKVAGQVGQAAVPVKVDAYPVQSEPTQEGPPVPPRRDVIIVSHGGSLYQLLKLWCGWPAPRHYFTRIGNCTCFKLELREVSGHLGAELQFMVPLELMEQMTPAQEFKVAN